MEQDKATHSSNSSNTPFPPNTLPLPVPFAYNSFAEVVAHSLFEYLTYLSGQFIPILFEMIKEMFRFIRSPWKREKNKKPMDQQKESQRRDTDTDSKRESLKTGSGPTSSSTLPLSQSSLNTGESAADVNHAVASVDRAPQPVNNNNNEQSLDDFLPDIAINNDNDNGIQKQISEMNMEPQNEVEDNSLTFMGEFTPTKFARADVFDKKTNQNPTSSLENNNKLKAGPSDIIPAEKIFKIPEYSPSMTIGIGLPPGELSFDQFLSVMEAQWEGRDTNNAMEADAVIGFLKFNPQKDDSERAHDGTKSTLNMFAFGRYAHPLPLDENNIFDIKPTHRSEDITILQEDKYVGYKIFQRNKDSPSLPDYASEWEKTSNDRFRNVPTHEENENVNPNWKQSMKEFAEKQSKIAKKSLPILALWGVDDATEEQLVALKQVTVDFLRTYAPKKLMLTGKRDKGIADRARNILAHALKEPKVVKEEDGNGSDIKIENGMTLITGGADGVDSIALHIVSKFESLRESSSESKSE